MDFSAQFKENSLKLFNLGLHLNNDKVNLSNVQPTFSRIGNSATIQNPFLNLEQLTGFIKLVNKVLENGGTVLLINTEGSLANRYQYLFEGLNVVCWEEPWEPGLLSNPLLGYKEPDVVVLVSARDADVKFIINEVNNLRLPLINLTSNRYKQELYASRVNNKAYIHFLMQVFIYICHSIQRKNIDSLLTTDIFLSKDPIEHILHEKFIGFSNNKAHVLKMSHRSYLPILKRNKAQLVNKRRSDRQAFIAIRIKSGKKRKKLRMLRSIRSEYF